MPFAPDVDFWKVGNSIISATEAPWVSSVFYRNRPTQEIEIPVQSSKRQLAK